MSGLVTVIQAPANGSHTPPASAEVSRSRTPEEASTPERASVPASTVTVTVPSASYPSG